MGGTLLMRARVQPRIPARPWRGNHALLPEILSYVVYEAEVYFVKPNP